MSRYIDADALITSIQENVKTLSEEAKLTKDFYIEYIRDFRKTPTADVVEVRHGKWLSAYEYALKIGITDKEKLAQLKEDKWWKFCPYCEQQVKWDFNFCPTCGAKMDGERSTKDAT